MPYKLIKVNGGYKVGKSDGKTMRNGRMYASNKPLSKEAAVKQMSALYASERKAKFRSFQFPEGYKVGRTDKKKLPNGRYYSTNHFLKKGEIRGEIKKIREKYAKQLNLK